LEKDSRVFWAENKNLFSETTLNYFHILCFSCFCFLTFLFLKPIAKQLVTVVKHVLLFLKQKNSFQNSNPKGKNSTFIKITTDTRGSELNNEV